MDISSPAYRKAFVRYLRRGVAIELTLKANNQLHPTDRYIWHTREDEKVRASHAANDGKVFSWDDPPPTGNPGDEYGCRCWAEPYYRPDDPNKDLPIEPVYPELFLIPLLRIRHLIDAWHEWTSHGNSDRTWRLNPRKSAVRWRNQLEKGNWTPQDIELTITFGERFIARNERTGGPASGYQLGDRFIIRDDTTGDILQVSRPGVIAKEFK